MTSTGTKVVVFLDAQEIETLDSITALLLCSRQEALRFLLSERKRAQVTFRAARAKAAKAPTKLPAYQENNGPKRGPGRPPKPDAKVEGME
jgi:hypothetical protein